MDNGWTRFTPPSDEQNGTPPLLRLFTSDRRSKLGHCWLSQANYVFRQYPITAHYEDYGQKLDLPQLCSSPLSIAVVWYMAYVLTVLPTSKIYPEGYLFLCPWDDLRSEDGGFVERPECPAYWSLDTSGCERLSPGEASAHGFPSFKWQRIVGFRSWDERVYAGLSQFHAGKGFDPYSQDVARHLGYPLYELSYRPSGARSTKFTPMLFSGVNPSYSRGSISKPGCGHDCG
ncbi:hypothetical protein B0H11DRAFT_1870089 [Mycena galericulata]|nr:hypothetical protein B0H11DRAFT_1870089 [Mycena galericulata]